MFEFFDSHPLIGILTLLGLSMLVAWLSLFVRWIMDRDWGRPGRPGDRPPDRPPDRPLP
jgi:hypothetical protein